MHIPIRGQAMIERFSIDRRFSLRASRAVFFAGAAPAHPMVTPRPSGRQAMNVPVSTVD
jgi:hypothetical protein